MLSSFYEGGQLKKIDSMSSIDFVKEMMQRKKDMDSESIQITADQLWRYSGEVEKDSEDYTNLITEAKLTTSTAKEYLTGKRYKSRKEYFRLYWQKYKLKQKNKL